MKREQLNRLLMLEETEKELLNLCRLLNTLPNGVNEKGELMVLVVNRALVRLAFFYVFTEQLEKLLNLVDYHVEHYSFIESFAKKVHKLPRLGEIFKERCKEFNRRTREIREIIQKQPEKTKKYMDLYPEQHPCVFYEVAADQIRSPKENDLGLNAFFTLVDITLQRDGDISSAICYVERSSSVTAIMLERYRIMEGRSFNTLTKKMDVFYHHPSISTYEKGLQEKANIEALKTRNFEVGLMDLECL